MSVAIDVLRGANGVAWCMVLIWCFSSIWRSAGHAASRPMDASWSLGWWFAFAMVGYTARWLANWSRVPEPGGDQASLLGLLVLTTMIALAIFVRRIRIGGWAL